jgi:hypothetical protein
MWCCSVHLATQVAEIYTVYIQFIEQSYVWSLLVHVRTAGMLVVAGITAGSQGHGAAAGSGAGRGATEATGVRL